jgi:formylglycine-generating enzyme required for sulfatase activity
MKNTILLLLFILGVTVTQAQVLVKMSPKAEKPKTEAKPKTVVKTKIVYVEKPTETQKNETKTSIEPAMVSIQGGSFNMGSNESDDEKPIHRVTVNSFKMGKYEVTVKEFAAFVNATNYQTDAEKIGKSWVYNSKWEESDGVTWRDDEEGRHRPETDWNKPAIHVSWNDATAYCDWLSKKTGKTFRLPTEAEWEFAAGSGPKHYKYSWGSYEPSNSENVGNVADETTHPKYGKWKNDGFVGYKDGYFFAAPVGSFQPNELGLYDMTGNVWEWCSDWYDATYYANSPGSNPVGPSSGSHRVLRGGSWCNTVSECRVAYRYYDGSAGRCGFRVVLSQ